MGTDFGLPAPPSMEEWFKGKVKAMFDADPQLSRRLMVGAVSGTGMVATHLSVPPPGGTPERDLWEKTCDKCGVVQPDTEHTAILRQAYPMVLNGLPVMLVASGMLCYPCCSTFGIERGDVPESVREGLAPGEPLAVVDEAAAKMGSAFGLVMGESATSMRNAVESAEARKHGRGGPS